MLSLIACVRRLWAWDSCIPTDFRLHQSRLAEEHYEELPGEQRRLLGAYRTCLVCYASSDLAFAEQLLQDLQAQGVVCESLPYDKEPGTNEHMIELCSVYDQLLLLLSDQVVIGDRRHDQFCGDTLYLIQKWHGGKTFRLFLNQIVPLLQGFLVPRCSRTDQDFTDWREPERYQHAFDRLLRNLKGEA